MAKKTSKAVVEETVIDPETSTAKPVSASAGKPPCICSNCMAPKAVLPNQIIKQ